MNAIGTAVTGGMLSATFIDLVFIPLFFIIVCTLFSKKTQSSVPQPVVISGIPTEVETSQAMDNMPSVAGVSCRAAARRMPG